MHANNMKQNTSTLSLMCCISFVSEIYLGLYEQSPNPSLCVVQEGYTSPLGISQYGSACGDIAEQDMRGLFDQNVDRHAISVKLEPDDTSISSDHQGYMHGGGTEPSISSDHQGYGGGTAHASAQSVIYMKSMPGEYPPNSETQPSGGQIAEPSRYPCNLCGKQFNWKCDLVRHTLVHSGQKPHACAVCGAAYGQAASLKLHMRRHTGERPFCCTVCLRTFTRRDSLNKHARLHDKPGLSMDVHVLGLPQ
jgi:hypothetical protein